MTGTTAPIEVEVQRNPYGTGEDTYRAYRMPERGVNGMWGDITSYPDEGHHVQCPVEGCGQELVHYEAGYVPGYRVCMAPMPDGRYDHETLRHRFTLDGRREFPERVLILDAR